VAAAAGGLQRGQALSFDTLEHFCTELGKPFPSPPLAFLGKEEGARGKRRSYGRGDKMAQRVVELQWTRDQGWAVWGCGEQMVMGAGEGVGWP